MNLLRFVAAREANVYATFVQAVGLWMFAFLLVVLARPVHREWFNAFAKSFVFLALAVSSLRVAFALGTPYDQPFFFSYFLGEYLFLYFLVLGTRRLAGHAEAPWPWPLLLTACAVAFALSLLTSFSHAFVFQAAIMAGGLFLAFGFALRKPARELPGTGLHLLRFSLVVLGVGFAQYVPVLGSALREGRNLPEIYATFMPVFDLLFESLLAFAMIVVGMESVQRQLASTNENLEEAKRKLDVLARTDPLTELMNRHAFAAVLDAPPAQAAFGSLAVIDLDGLKAINDTHGHHVGDQAIRAFARALRARLRADDLIFRWGGDEFLAVMFGLPEAETTARLQAVGDVDVVTDGTTRPVQIRGSFGVAPFGCIGDLRAAAQGADAAMYEAKRERARARA